MTTTTTRAALEAELAGRRRAPKPFTRTWLDIGALPPLLATDGVPLTGAAIGELFAAQAKQRGPDVAEAAAAWIAVVDRTRSGDFALALVDQWLASEQDAKDRFALFVAGRLGDDRIADRLAPSIPRWCDMARHKLAEYAAHAIALVGSDHALAMLDTLRTRYRAKFRNVGAAAEVAFMTAAAARGLTKDELGDRVMPTLGFDADGRRRFEWAGDGAIAEIAVDGKLRWHALDDSKQWKSLPKSAPEDVVQTVKELGKSLREALKAQATRLEGALVRQRRWTAARFAELFLQQPIGRVFASRLVFGVYGADGTLLRCCRRYPNGILADADGGLEELAEPGLEVGIVHPLELDPDELARWRAHLQRVAATPPFPQLDRPVDRLDPQHANRKDLAIAQGRSVGIGTFRSRAERRGWNRGSVADAGGIASYWKEFPGCGVEVALDTEGLFIGVDPMESIKLGVARFVPAGSIERGSYHYDMPDADDARVLTFGAVPAIVWSETVADLRAIVGEA